MQHGTVTAFTISMQQIQRYSSYSLDYWQSSTLKIRTASSSFGETLPNVQMTWSLTFARIYQWNCPFPSFLQQSYPFARPQKVSVVNSTFCNQNASNQYTQLENIDLCSYYQFTQPELCQSTGRRLTFSYDRGAALICDNKLVGILSIVLPANRSNSSEIYCNATSQTNAYFTNTALYLDWIRSVIVSETSTQTIEGVPVSVNPSVPAYQSRFHSQIIFDHFRHMHCI